MPLNCEMLDLRAFLAVLDLGSFHRAATVLNISQPALSRRIKALEGTMGGRLFERSTRRVRPTRTGQNFEPLARRVVEEFDYAISRVCPGGQKNAGQLTVAAIPTAAISWLPSVLSIFRETYPNTRLRILDMPGNEGLDAVARGEAEFGINYLGSSHSEYNFTPLLDDAFTLVCRKDDPLAKQRRIKWSDLADRPLVISQNNSNRTLIDQALSRSKISLNWTFEVVHLSTSFGLVASGIAMAILPKMVIPAEGHPALTAIPLEHPAVARTMGIVELRRRQLSPAAASLRQLLIDHARPLRRKAGA